MLQEELEKEMMSLDEAEKLFEEEQRRNELELDAEMDAEMKTGKGS